MKTKYGDRTACRYCEHDIEFHGREHGWVDRGGGRDCLPYKDWKTKEIVRPTTKHAPPVKAPQPTHNPPAKTVKWPFPLGGLGY